MLRFLPVIALSLLLSIFSCTKLFSGSGALFEIHILWPQSADQFRIHTIPANTDRIEIEIQGDGMAEPFKQIVKRTPAIQETVRLVLPFGQKAVSAKAFGADNKLLASDIQSIVLDEGRKNMVVLNLQEPKQTAIPTVPGSTSGLTPAKFLGPNGLPLSGGIATAPGNPSLHLPTDTALLDHQTGEENSIVDTTQQASLGSTAQLTGSVPNVNASATPVPSDNPSVPPFIVPTPVSFAPQPSSPPLILSLPPTPTPPPTPGITNNAPVITNIVALNAQGTHLLLSGLRFDPSPGNNVVRFGPFVATVNTATNISLDVNVLLANGTYNVTVTVGPNVSNTIKLTYPIPPVLNDQPPVINNMVANPNPISGLGFPTEVTVTASDAEETLTDASYTWSCDGGCGAFDQITGPKVIWTAPTVAGTGGVYTIRVSVTDGVNIPVQGTVQIFVNSGMGAVNVTAR